MNSTFMLQSYVTIRHTDAENEYGVATSQSVNEGHIFPLISKYLGLKSVTMASNMTRWHASPMMHYSRKHFTSMNDTR